MKISIAKIKNFALYSFAVIGVVYVLFSLVGLSFSLVSLGGARRAMNGSSELTNPLTILTPGLPDFSVSNEATWQEKSEQQNTEISEGPLTQRKIIKEGSLSLLVRRAEETAENIQGVANRLEGFVANSQIWEVSEGVKSGRVTIRVPADHFDEAVDEIKRLAVKVESETTSAKDVTEEFVDLEARLKNLRAQEEQYLEIMERADTVEDILKVSQRLGEVRGQIEQIEGKLKYLSRQVEMSTITVSLTSEAEVEVFGIRWRPLFVVKQSFKNMLTGLTGYANAMVRFIFALPVIALWLTTIVLVGFVGWRILAWIRKRFSL